MGLFNFSQNEILTFFVALVRFATLFAVLPFTGDRYVPVPVKALLALVVTFALFPSLVGQGLLRPSEASVWAASAGSIAATVALEVVFGLALGFTARLAFDAIQFGANLAGSYMGFASASTFDPHQESQTQVIGQMQLAIAMLIFLAINGHLVMLRAALDSYRIVGLGRAGLGAAFSQRLLDITSQTVRFGFQISAPVAVSLFAVNVAFGVMAKALPQLNVLILSLSVTALVGLFVMFISVPDFQAASVAVLDRVGTWMNQMMAAMAA